MNLLEKLKLVEPINGSEEEVFVEHEDPAPVVTADFSANAGTSAADIIDAIYNATDMEDKSNSIYRVKDFMNTIPVETPEKTAKVIVLNLLDTLGLSVDGVKADSDARMNALNGTMNATLEDNNAKQNELVAHIESLRVQIETDKQSIQELVRDADSLKQAVESEKNEIMSVLRFIGVNQEVETNAAQ